MTAKEELQQILAKEEYQIYYRQRQNLWQKWLEQFQDWLSRFLHSIFPRTEITPGTSNWPAYVLIAVCLLLVITLLILFLSRFVRRRRLQQRVVSSAKELELSFTRHLHEAARYREQAEYGLALRHLFLGFILFLDQKGLLEARAWKTNGEYYQELEKTNKDLAADFYKIALKFEETIYGSRPLTPEQLQNYFNLTQNWLSKGEKNAGQILFQEP